MKHSHADHVVALSKALVNLAPGGGAIASLIEHYIPSSQEKARERAFELFSEKVERLEARMDVDAVNKEDFAEAKIWPGHVHSSRPRQTLREQ